SARIQRRQGVSDPSLKQLSMVGVIGATRLASATEVQEVLEAIIKGEGVFPDKTSQPTKDETTIRLYRHMLSEDPARAFNLGTTINVLALLKRIDERNK
ncbi:MAG: hypothetical protein KDB07_11855, partial [Planctomycetes bacterium]|nr:hypothetical protein [Planctomycetota bacterium]